MALKKQHFAEGEIAIFDEACIYNQAENWQTLIWLPKEKKYGPSVKSLDGIDGLPKYQHLSQLLHIQKAVRDKR